MEKERKLIYADSLREAEEHVFFVGGRGGKTKTLLDSMIDRLIKDAPPVDAVEVVHGRWIPVPSSDMMTGKAYKCSECNKMRYGSFMPNYCQNCGAKMDGERRDNG